MIFISILCGAICGNIVYKIYEKKIDIELNGEKIYLIQSESYSTYDSMISNTLMNNYIYFKDSDGLYKLVIALTKDYDNIKKIKNTYTDDIIITEYYSKNNLLNQELKEFDQKLKQANTEEEIKKIIEKMLILYKDATLTQALS